AVVIQVRPQYSGQIGGTEKHLDRHLQKRRIAVHHRPQRIDRRGGLVVEGLLFHVRQGEGFPTSAPLPREGKTGGGKGGDQLPAAVKISINIAGREALHGPVVVVQSQADLLEVVLTLAACGGLTHLLHGGQEQANEDGDDGDHHQQLDQGETRPGSLRGEHSESPVVHEYEDEQYSALCQIGKRT